jgi:hypothetical protein
MRALAWLRRASILLVVSLALTGCASVPGPQGLPPVTQRLILHNVYASVAEVQAAHLKALGHEGHAPVYGFATWQPDGSGACEIHYPLNDRVTKEHEEAHCWWGRWHTSPNTQNNQQE